MFDTFPQKSRQPLCHLLAKCVWWTWAPSPQHQPRSPTSKSVSHSENKFDNLLIYVLHRPLASTIFSLVVLQVECQRGFIWDHCFFHCGHSRKAFFCLFYIFLFKKLNSNPFEIRGKQSSRKQEKVQQPPIYPSCLKKTCLTGTIYRRLTVPFSFSPFACFSHSVPNYVQRRGGGPGALCQSGIQLHHQQYLRRERGEWMRLTEGVGWGVANLVAANTM